MAAAVAILLTILTLILAIVRLFTITSTIGFISDLVYHGISAPTPYFQPHNSLRFPRLVVRALRHMC